MLFGNLLLNCIRIIIFTLSAGNCRGCILIIDGVLTIPFQVIPSVNLSLQIAYAVRSRFDKSGFILFKDLYFYLVDCYL